MNKINFSKCFIDGSQKRTLILRVDSYSLFRCPSCDLISLFPQINTRQTSYSDSLNISAYVKYMKPLRLNQYRKDIEAIKTYARGTKLLDIGCALGWFMDEAAKKGFHTFGLEPQKDLVNIAKKENPHSKIFYGSLETINNMSRNYNVVTLWSVMEHFQNPEFAINRINRILKNGSILAIRTPNSKSLVNRIGFLLYRLSQGRIKNPINAILQLSFQSKHWFLYSPNNLSKLLKKHGFVVLKKYYSTSVDYRYLKGWFKSRYLKYNWLTLISYQIFFALNQLLSSFSLADDFVLIARKKSAGKKP